MKFLAVDDENIQLLKLVDAIKEVAPDNEVVTFHNPLEVLEYPEVASFDVAFLDIEMPGMNGVELAKRLKEVNPSINIIFVTGYTEYALDAYSLHASGYLTKPITSERIKLELDDLRFPMPRGGRIKRIRVQCFGDFEVYCEEEPLKFARSKTKEMLAYLVDREGAMVKLDELSKVLFNEEKASYMRNLVADLVKTFKAVGEEGIIIKHFNSIGVDKYAFECDYYDYINNEPYAVKKYRGEYLNQYPWAKALKKQHFKK